MVQDILANTAVVCFVLALFIMLAGYGVAAGIVTGVCILALTGILTWALPNLLKFLKTRLAITAAAFGSSLVIPVLMGAQEWDDHDRSKKQLSRDIARDYLESCAPNAILFTFGDNDTYPLWYAQEVERIRPDVRIIITTLLGTNWLINELRHKVNDSDPIDVIWAPEQIAGHKRDYILYQPQPAFPDNRYYDLYDMMKNWVGSDDPSKMVDRGDGEQYNTFPVRKLSVPVDTNLVRANGTVNVDDHIVNEMRFELPVKNALMKNDQAMLNIIAANKWKRPVYFTMPDNSLGLAKYLRKDGLAYRLVPVENPSLNTDKMYGLVMDPKKWGYGNAHLPGVYYDEVNRTQLLNIRRADLELAFDLIFNNRENDAKKILAHNDKMIADDNLPYAMTSRYNEHNKVSLGFLEACYRVNDRVLAGKILTALKKDLQQQQDYYASLDENKRQNLQFEETTTQNMVTALKNLEQRYSSSRHTDMQ